MIVTDAQVHIWLGDRPDRPWPEIGKSYAHGLDDYTEEHLLPEMDAAGVDRAIIVPPSFEGDYNDAALAAAHAHPDRFAVMGRLALDDPAGREQVAGWRERPGMLGVRVTMTRGPSATWLADGTADWFWKAAEDAGVPVMLYAHGEVPAIRRIAERHPGLRLTLDHLLVPTEARDAQVTPYLEQTLSLADLPNVAAKATCLPSMTTEAYPFPSLHGIVRRTLEAFGPRRVFWGSDITRLPCPYREAVTMFTEELDFLSGEDLEWIMGRGVEAWLGWQPGSRAVHG